MSVSSVAPAKKPLLSDRFYNGLKKITTLFLPAVGALYVALAPIWHFPKAEEVVGSISAITLFLGGLLHVSSSSYTATQPTTVGNLIAQEHPDGSGKQILVAHLNDDAKPSEIAEMDQVVFKVGP